jgi:hypothetical protein
MIKYKQGDLLQAFENKEVDIIAHTCNATVGMGGGIARAIALKYPEIQVFDSTLRKQGNILGTSQPFFVDSKIVYNVYAQYYPGKTRLEFDTFEDRIKWLKQGLIWINQWNKNKTVGVPLLSSGLGCDLKRKKKLNDLEYFKKYIAPIVEETLVDMDVTVYYL